MVTASAKKKKKVKKSSKRKAVNLQSNFNRKCNGSGNNNSSTDISTMEMYETIRAEMFPTNHDDDAPQQHDNVAIDAAGEFCCGDFHLHSVCSDGKLRPSDVIAKAAANGVVYMSLTDHDTMAGVQEAIDAAKKLNVLVFPGVEISAEVKGGENLHILGYFSPGSNSIELENQLQKIRTGRHKRGKGMLQKLGAMGIKLQWERVLEIAGEAAPGRPHVAQALVEGGFVSSFKEAFARYLHNDGPAYVEGEHFPPEEAIKLIASTGGISVLAHPWCCKNPLTLVPELARFGIQGLEVYHDTSKIDMYGALAAESGLLKLGGSDFHGIDASTEHAPGEIPLPRKHIDAFLAHAKQVWADPLVKRLEEMMKQVQNGEDAGEMLIWREQEELVHTTLAAKGMEMYYSDGSSVEERECSHYRTLRIREVM